MEPRLREPRKLVSSAPVRLPQRRPSMEPRLVSRGNRRDLERPDRGDLQWSRGS